MAERKYWVKGDLVALTPIPDYLRVYAHVSGPSGGKHIRCHYVGVSSTNEAHIYYLDPTGLITRAESIPGFIDIERVNMNNDETMFDFEFKARYPWMKEHINSGEMII